MFSNWVFYVVLYLFFVTIFTQFYKVSTKNLKNAGALTILVQLVAGLSILLFVPFFEIKFPTDIKVYMFLGLSIIFYTIADRLNTTVRSGLEASTFSILSQVYSVFMTFAGLVFLKEEFVLTKFIGAMLIIFSNVLIFYEKGKAKIDKYVIMGIIANLSMSIAVFLDVNVSNNFNLPLYIASTLTIPATLIFLIERIKISELKEEFRLVNKPALFITAISWSLSILCNLTAYQLGNVSVVAPLCALTVILNVIIGYIFLKERDNLLKKVIAAVLIIVSIGLMQL